jgi:hypothetical protein
MAAAAPSQAPPPAGPTPGRRSAGGLLPTVIGLLVALAAVAVYFLYFVRSPPPPPAVDVARLTVVEGNVRVKPAGATDWAQGHPSGALKTGDLVQTDPRSGAEVTFFTGNVVRIRPDSVVLISAGEAAVAEDATAWHIQSGQVSFELKRDMDIVTSTARTRASANSSGNVDVSDEGVTGVKIFRGSAQVATRQGDTVLLSDNQAVVVDQQGKAGPRIELPPAPRLIAPPGKAEVPYVPPPDATATLEWEPVRGAETYRVAMDYNVHRAELLLSAALDEPRIPETAHQLRALDPGSYFWRVAGVSREGVEGDFSRVSSFSVIERPPAAPPRLLVEATVVLDGVVLVSGRTDPGAVVAVDGVAVTVLPDGSFGEHLRTSTTGPLVVRATNPDGQFTEREAAVRAR